MRNRMNMVPWLVAAGCLAAALACRESLGRCRRTLAESRVERMLLEERLERVDADNRVLRAAAEKSVEKRRREVAAALSHRPRLSDREARELAEKGWTVGNVAGDLMRHPELIPFTGVLGGTMGFQDPRDIHVLTTRLVRAYADDGHIVGWMLLEFTPGKDGALAWKVLDSGLE